ncbi:hypothetical protein AB0F43_01445 [Kribbella sp. NPDC023972]|uniref:hypothetical protein n=1 Tax=Kribbella sp. NPDC023972 TaxID=3154795 RepID=UPI0034073197
MTTVSPAQRSLTVTASALLAAIPLITLAMWFVLAVDGIGDFPPTWAPSFVLLAAALAYAVCELVGFRTSPLQHSDRSPAEVGMDSWRRFTASTFVRFAACEAVFLISLPLAFVVESFWVILTGAALAIPLFLWEVWPGVRNQQRFAAALEAGGVPSYLTEGR